MTSALKFPKNGPVPGRDHATRMLQKKKIHEISCLRSRSLDPGRDHVYTFCKKPKFIDILFWAREIPMLKFHNAKWIMQMIEFQWCKTLILIIHALVLAWYENHTMKTRLRACEVPMFKFHVQRPGTGACFFFGFWFFLFWVRHWIVMFFMIHFA